LVHPTSACLAWWRQFCRGWLKKADKLLS
jgi:hypothetical protein